MSATNVSRTRPLPRPLQLVSNSISVPSSPISTTLNDLKSSTSSGDTKEVTSSISRNNAPRRQSSISYNTGSSKSRSPGLVRSNSTGINTESAAINIKGQTDPIYAPRTSPLTAVRETETVTLAEKHADLLRFIAQKESKCLELRTQLAQHEADLLLLKAKWERIVSKGLPSSSRPETSIYAAVDKLGDIREGIQNGLEKVLSVLEPSAVSASFQPIKSHEVSHINTPVTSPSYSSKRTSISTASSSTRDWSSLSNSRSSASSLFDDISSANPNSLDSSTKDDDDGNDETVCLSSGVDKLPSGTKSLSRTSQSTGRSPTLEEDDDTSGKKRRSRPLSMSLSQFSSTLPTVEALTPIGKQMTNWVSPGLNKKWEELKGNETISKQSRRATLLFNDMLAALSSPQTPSLSTSTRYKNRTSPISPLVTDTSFFTMGTLSSPGFGSKASVSPSSTSLLDDDTNFGSGIVMQPDIMSTSDRRTSDDNAKPESESEEDEWNW